MSSGVIAIDGWDDRTGGLLTSKPDSVTDNHKHEGCTSSELDDTDDHQNEDRERTMEHDTHDCWDCCGLGRDDFQVFTVSRGRYAYVNTTVRLGPSVGGVVNTVVATPATPGVYQGATFARALWPQCAVYSVGNYLPILPFAVNFTNATSSNPDP